MATALILAGAVAKGAFEAGVLSVLAREVSDITHIVATSAGALNGAVYAAGVRLGRAGLAAKVLDELWRERASFSNVVRPSLGAILHARGVSDASALREVVSEALQRVTRDATASATRAEIELGLVTATLAGKVVSSQGGGEATTFEHLVAFRSEDFDSERGRERVREAALASAAFPFLFTPLKIEDVGACIDGGAVNNTPISYAIDGGVARVIVVTGNPVRSVDASEFNGADLVGQIVDIVINERLFRDLHRARRINEKLTELEAVFERLGLGDGPREQIRTTLGWKPLEVVEIRPKTALRGNAFSGLRDAGLRAEYIAIGQEVAAEVLRGLPR
jgi:NTE family protein